MYRAPSVGARQRSACACGLAGASGSHWCEGRGWDPWGMIAEAGEKFAHKGRIRRGELGRGLPRLCAYGMSATGDFE